MDHSNYTGWHLRCPLVDSREPQGPTGATAREGLNVAANSQAFSSHCTAGLALAQWVPVPMELAFPSDGGLAGVGFFSWADACLQFD